MNVYNRFERNMRIYFSIFMVLFVSNIFAQNQLISFRIDGITNSSTEPIRTIDDNGLDGISIQYDFNSAIVHNKNVQGSFYQHFYIKNFTQTQEVGKPMLPVHTDLILIPQGASLNIHLIDSNSIDYSNFLVHPSNRQDSDQYGTNESNFNIDSSFYQSNSYYPSQRVQLKGLIHIRGLQFALIEVHPMQYKPSDGSLKVSSLIKYRVSFTNCSRFINYDNYSHSFLKQIPNLALNNQHLKLAIDHYIALNQNQNPLPNEPNYLILTHQNYKKAADSLAKWKSQLGFKTEVIIGINWSSAGIKNAIQTRYQNQQSKPEYVVLLGDHEKIPAINNGGSTGIGVYTDLYYSCFDNSTDFMPDLALGRISVSDSTQAMEIIQKIINYERTPIGNSSFYNTGSTISSFSSNNGIAKRKYAQTTEEVRDYLLSKNYQVNRIYSASNSTNPIQWNNDIYSDGQPITNNLQKPNYAWNGNSATINQELLSGNFFLLYRSQSSYTAWNSPQFNFSDINLLNNGDKLPVVFSLGGNSGNFIEPQCFAEKLFKKANGGAVSVFSQSRSTIASGINNAMSLSIIDAIWSNPGLVPDFQTTYSSGAQVTLHNDLNKLGDIKNQSLIRAIEIWGSDINLIKENNESFSLLGDPSLKMWTTQPSTITVSTSAILHCKTDTHLIVNSNVDGLATLVLNDEIISATIIQSGVGTLYFNAVSGDEVLLTISADNYIPYIIHIPISGNCPNAKFSVSSKDNCITDSFHIENLSNLTNANYQWNFGIGAIPATASGFGPFDIHYTNSGIKNISLILTDSNSNHSIFTESVIVDSLCIKAIPSNGQITTNECSGLLADNGQMGSYTNNVFGSYTISPPAATSISLSFIELDMQSGNDRINIYDGPSNSSTLLLSLSGNIVPSSPIISSGNSITIEQQTDAQGIGTGFLMEWNCISSISQPTANFFSPDSSSCSNEIKFYDYTQGGVDSWSWDFGDGTHSTLQHPTHKYLQNGTYNVKLIAGNSYGLDSLIKSNYVSVNRPNAPITNNEMRCNSGTLDLSAQYNTGTLFWYNQLTKGQLLDTGIVYTTPIIDSTKSYFVELHQYTTPISVGKDDNTGNGSYSNASSIDYLIFDVLKNTHLISIDVYASTNGYRSFHLLNSANDLINSITLYLTIGKNTIELNWNLNQGIEYRIAASAHNFLFKNTTTNFPYTDGKTVIINGNSNQDADYFYFYNWKLRSDACISPRVEVKAIVSDTLGAVSTFSINNIDPKIEFINQSKYADSYYWDFGDGDFSLLANPSHIYQNDGLYQVQLISSNNCGTSVSSLSISISGTSVNSANFIQDFKVFPNPTKSVVNIEFKLLQSQSIDLKLYNLLGQVVRNIDVDSKLHKQLYSIDVNDLAKGVYFIKLSSESQTIQKKIILN